MKNWILAVSLVLGFSMTVHAEDHGHHGDKGPHGACAQDREKLCPKMEKGEALMKCMKDNADKLSAECKAHHEKMKGEGCCHGEGEKMNCMGDKHHEGHSCGGHKADDKKVDDKKVEEKKTEEKK